MPFLDIFKKRKKKPERKLKEKKRVQEELKKEKDSDFSIGRGKKKTQKKKIKSKIAFRIFKGPHITEKATNLSSNNQYTFLIWPRANKAEIKKAVEDLYNVDVTRVNIIKIPPKRRRIGRTTGWKKGYKKAIVTVKKDQKIDIFPK